MKQVCSARWSTRSARATSTPAGMRSVARTSMRVKRVAFSTRSSVPVASASSEIHGIFEACAMARNESTKQLATAATSSDSGDQRSPGPPNSAGGAAAIVGSFSAASATSPSGCALARTA